jgi:hypothetical protein
MYCRLLTRFSIKVHFKATRFYVDIRKLASEAKKPKYSVNKSGEF